MDDLARLKEEIAKIIEPTELRRRDEGIEYHEHKVADALTKAEAILALFSDLLAERERQDAEIVRLREAWVWLAANENLSIDFRGPVYCDDDDQTEEWRVSRESGPINDREWDVIATGATPLEAVLAASALQPSREPGKGNPCGASASVIG